jgi:hypothetical protein
MQTLVKIRPILSIERKDQDVSCITTLNDGKKLNVRVNSSITESFTCSKSFSVKTSQASFFSESNVTQLIDAATNGATVSVFTFGKTGAGKSYTLFGLSKGFNCGGKHDGVATRSLDYIFAKLKDMGPQYVVRVSFLEIFEEQVFDIFAKDGNKGVPLTVKLDSETNEYSAEGRRRVECDSYRRAKHLVGSAFKARLEGIDPEREARSHVVLEISIDTFVSEIGSISSIASLDGNRSATSAGEYSNSSKYVPFGKIFFVDTAGCETMQSARDGTENDKSLYVLSKVMAGLEVQANSNTSPMESVLTKMLLSSVGNPARSLLIANVLEGSLHVAETVKTLKIWYCDMFSAICENIFSFVNHLLCVFCVTIFL